MSKSEYTLPSGYKLLWYSLESILGQGGFGITYLANDGNLKHKVAIKEFFPFDVAKRAPDHSVLNSSPDIYDWGLSQFISEAQTLAKCVHPNIVAVNSVFEANKTAYIVMEYINGHSLKAAIKHGWQPGEAALKKFLFAVMDGLSQVHERGFIHRDIKPDNIILRKNMSPVLVDFGSARKSDNEMTSLVSSGYTPFEQYDTSRRSDKQGPWTDIYSLGATVYTVITGESPVDSITRLGSLLKGAVDPLPLISKPAVKGYSARFLQAIDSALAVQPTDRPQSIEQWKALFSEPANDQMGCEADKILDAGSDKQTRRKKMEVQSTKEARTVVITDRARPDSNQKISTNKARLVSNKQVSPNKARRDSNKQVFANQPRPGSNQQVLVNKRAKSASPNATKKWLPLFLISLVIVVAAIVVIFTMRIEQDAKPGSGIASSNDSRGNIQKFNNTEQETVRDLWTVAEQDSTMSVSAEIQSLLSKAENDIKSSRLILPADQNAEDRYLRILELDPDNAEAVAGLNRIRRFHGYLDLTERAIINKHFGRAEEYLRMAEQIFPGIDLVNRTRARIQEATAVAERF